MDSSLRADARLITGYAVVARRAATRERSPESAERTA